MKEYIAPSQLTLETKMTEFKIAIAALLFFPAMGWSQIEVEEYPRQLKADVDVVDQFDAVKATSSCGEVTSTISEQIFSGGCLGTLVRTYTFTDECGNEARAEQYIGLQDSQKPVFQTQMQDMTMSRADRSDPERIVAKDNSGKPVDIQFSEVEKGNKIIRTWRATDICGNETEMRQTITFSDL